MVLSTEVIIPKEVEGVLIKWAEKAYPNEGCGLLVGHFESNGKKSVVRFIGVENRMLDPHRKAAPTLPSERQGDKAGKTEFVLDPNDFNRITLQAEKEGMEVVGIMHTHPDHPPIPSVIDEAQPFLSQWSNIIIAVEQGKVRDIKAWYREMDDQPFQEEAIRIN